jgi:diacylglycerol kinase (ATP)
MERLIAVLINPFAKTKKAKEAQSQTFKYLKDKALAFEVFGAIYPSEAGLAKFTEIIVVGGDGTLNHVLNSFDSIKLPMAIIAGGTGNDFARKLNGNISIAEQLQIAVGSNTQKVDTGCCNNRKFHNGVGIGFDGNVVFKTLKGKSFSGIWAYYVKVIPLLFTYKEISYTISYNTTEVKEDLLLITVANGQFYGGGFNLAPLADIQDGLLDVGLIKKLPLLKRLLYMPKVQKGQHLSFPFVEYFNVEKIQIKASGPTHAHIDGEYLFSDTFKIHINTGSYIFKIA